MLLSSNLTSNSPISFSNVATQRISWFGVNLMYCLIQQSTFDIKWYVREQTLSLMYQAFLGKYKVHERSLVYYC